MFHRLALSCGFLLLISAGGTHAAEATGSFQSATPSAEGWAIHSQPGDGRYEYRPPVEDRRIVVKPFFITPPKRTDFTFLSAQEEQALKAMAVRLAAESAKPEEVLKSSRVKVRHVGMSILWPKVVVRSKSEVCVPSLRFTDSVEWKSHLTCFTSTEVLAGE